MPTPGGPEPVALHNLREDVHIHAPYHVIRDRLLAITAHAEWLGGHFQDYQADRGRLEFRLVLAGHCEEARLQVDDSDPFGVRYHRDQRAPARSEREIEELNWALHVETAQDAHLTLEAVYRPRRGLLGPLFEWIWLRPQRTQALRESLWNLKQLIEREYPRQPIF